MARTKNERAELPGFDQATAGPALGATGRPLRTFAEPKPLKGHGPARIIALCNQKGGVGKTTTGDQSGRLLADYGRRVLAVDFDPQGALSAGLGVQVHDVPTIYDLLLSSSKDPAEAIQHTAVPGLEHHPPPTSISRLPRCTS